MKPEEFIKTLISVLDNLDKKASKKEPQPVIININGESGSAQINTGTDNSEEQEEIVPDNTGKFIPPIQQNIEIMKKNAGIKSAYDDEIGRAHV